VIAAIHGRCYGAGIQLALAADFRVVAPDAELSVMESKWGLIPDMSGTLALRELVGIDRAKLLAMTARCIDGEEAVRIGIATEVAEDPVQTARDLAAELAARSPDCVAAAKKILQENWLESAPRALARERRVQSLLIIGRNFREAMRANFRRKRPVFVDRSPLV
jgi:enoyl-CoA hydratase/carnithine racemase